MFALLRFAASGWSGLPIAARAPLHSLDLLRLATIGTLQHAGLGTQISQSYSTDAGGDDSPVKGKADWRRWVESQLTERTRAPPESEDQAVEAPELGAAEAAADTSESEEQLEAATHAGSLSHPSQAAAITQPAQSQPDLEAAAPSAEPQEPPETAYLSPSPPQWNQTTYRHIGVHAELFKPIPAEGKAGAVAEVQATSTLAGVMPDYGALGETSTPSPSRVVLSESRPPPRISPTRLFFPGQTYSPEDLNPFHQQDAAAKQQAMWKKPEKLPSSTEVLRKGDFRNVAFLNVFVSEMGNLAPRRRTRLRQKTHRHLCRQIKLAQHMALMPVNSKLNLKDFGAGPARQGSAPRSAASLVRSRPPTAVVPNRTVLEQR